jgi:hypothetical protein
VSRKSSNKARRRERARNEAQSQAVAPVHVIASQPEEKPQAAAPAQGAAAQPEAPRAVAVQPPPSEPEDRPSTLPPEALEAHDAFVRSPAAVIESLGIRVSAAVAAKLRQSSLPPPPSLEG